MIWIGGGMTTNTMCTNPASTKAWQPDKFKGMCKTEQACEEGLAKELCLLMPKLTTTKNSKKTTFIAFCKKVQEEMEVHGMDSVF